MASLIPDELAAEMFEVYHELTVIGMALLELRGQVKEVSKRFDETQAKLNALIARAKNGQTVLFEGGEQSDTEA